MNPQTLELCFPTDRVAPLHLIDACLRSREPGVPPTVAKLDKQPLVGRTAEVTFTEVTAVCSCRQLLILTHTQSQYELLLKSGAEFVSETLLTSSIPATGSLIPLIRPIQHMTPKMGGSFTSTIEPTSSSPSSPASPFSPAASR